MPRIIEAFKQFLDGKGNPIPYGKLYFTGIGANDTVDKDTYSDQSQTLANTNPVLLDGEGNCPDVWGTGSYTVKLFTKNDVFVREFTPVGGTGDGITPFSDWNELINYQTSNPPVKGSDGYYYQSRTDNNLGNDPVTDGGSNWYRVRFLQDYNALNTYAEDEIVVDDGVIWTSQQDANTGNTPSSDDGTWWLPSVDGSKILEIIALEARTTTVIPQTGGGTLTALRVNELQDGDSYSLPLANTVEEDQTITITQPDAYISFTPVVSRSGSDTITYSGGTDTSVTFNSGSSISLTLTSDGVSDWRL